jgi:OOP family OmpA-OmpF porin
LVSRPSLACKSLVVVPSNNGGGYQFAHSGDAYAGIFLMQLPYLDAREYLQVELSSSLISEVLYHFEMYVNLCNLSSFAIEDVGIYFSDTNDFQPFSVMPQIINSSGFISDTLNWTLISGDYIANGGETYLTIGNFKNDSNTDTTFIGQNSSQLLSYIYVDDVSLTSSTGISNNSENVLINMTMTLCKIGILIDDVHTAYPTKPRPEKCGWHACVF